MANAQLSITRVYNWIPESLMNLNMISKVFIYVAISKEKMKNYFNCDEIF